MSELLETGAFQELEPILHTEAQEHYPFIDSHIEQSTVLMRHGGALHHAPLHYVRPWMWAVAGPHGSAEIDVTDLWETIPCGANAGTRQAARMGEGSVLVYIRGTMKGALRVWGATWATYGVVGASWLGLPGAATGVPAVFMAEADLRRTYADERRLAGYELVRIPGSWVDDHGNRVARPLAFVPARGSLRIDLGAGPGPVAIAGLPVAFSSPRSRLRRPAWPPRHGRPPARDHVALWRLMARARDEGIELGSAALNDPGVPGVDELKARLLDPTRHGEIQALLAGASEPHRFERLSHGAELAPAPPPTRSRLPHLGVADRWRHPTRR